MRTDGRATHAGKTLFLIDDTWLPRINRTDRTGLNTGSAARASSPRTRNNFHGETPSVRPISGNDRQRPIIACKLGANLLRKNSQFSQVDLVRSAAGKLSDKRMLGYRRHGAHYAKSCRQSRIEEFEKRIVISSVAVNANNNGRRAVGMQGSDTLDGNCRNASVVAGSGNHSHIVRGKRDSLEIFSRLRKVHAEKMLGQTPRQSFRNGSGASGRTKTHIDHAHDSSPEQTASGGPLCPTLRFHSCKYFPRRWIYRI